MRILLLAAAACCAASGAAAEAPPPPEAPPPETPTAGTLDGQYPRFGPIRLGPIRLGQEAPAAGGPPSLLAQAAAPPPTTSATQPSQTPPASGPAPTFAWRSGRPTVTLFGGNLTIQPVTRFDVDMGGFFDQPIYATFPNPTKYLSESERTGVPDVGMNVRRARLGLQGTYLQDFTYNFTWEFAPGVGAQFLPEKNSRLFELQTAYTGIRWVTPRVGAYTLMQTIPYAMSSFELTQLERPAIVQIVTQLGSGDSRLAVGGEARGDRWFASFYLSDGATTSLNDGRQRNIVGRANGTVLDTGFARAILGVNGIAQLAGGTKGNPNATNFRDYPEVRLDPARLFATGTLRNIETGWAIGPELQALVGPVYIQSEYYSVNVSFSNGASNRNFRGYYVDGSFPLTGAPRRYDRLRGVFTRPRFDDFDPAAGNWGWLEFSARWSWASLNDYPTRGGTQGILGLALNWYPTSRLRASIQYMLGDVRLQQGTSASPAGADRSFQALVGRLSFNL